MSQFDTCISYDLCDQELQNDVVARLLAFGGVGAEIQNYCGTDELLSPLREHTLQIEIDEYLEQDRRMVIFRAGGFGLRLAEPRSHQTLACCKIEGAFVPCVRREVQLSTSGRLELMLRSDLNGEYGYIGLDGHLISWKEPETRLACKQAICNAAGITLDSTILVHDYSDRLVPYLGVEEVKKFSAVMTRDGNIQPFARYGLSKVVSRFRHSAGKLLKSLIML